VVLTVLAPVFCISFPSINRQRSHLFKSFFHISELEAGLDLSPWNSCILLGKKQKSFQVNLLSFLFIYLDFLIKFGGKSLFFLYISVLTGVIVFDLCSKRDQGQQQASKL
jgi:hypothetical protein